MIQNWWHETLGNLENTIIILLFLKCQPVGSKWGLTGKEISILFTITCLCIRLSFFFSFYTLMQWKCRNRWTVSNEKHRSIR